jgi:cytochrome c-type biogenesis protein CcmH
LEQAGAARLFVAAGLLAGGLSAAGLAFYFRAGPSPLDDTLPIPAVNQGTVPDNAGLVRRLNEHLQRQPRDARAWAILARLQFELDHFVEAAQAYEIALALPSKVANDPAVWCEYADALGMTQGGTLAGKPHELIKRALAINASHPKVLEMAGSAAYEQGDYAAALRYWQTLLAALDEGSRAHAELTAAIARAERRAKVTLPAPGR